MSFGELLCIAPGTKPDFPTIDPTSTPGFDGDKDAAHDRLKELRHELTSFQERMWAEGRQPAHRAPALDAGSKDSLIRK